MQALLELAHVREAEGAKVDHGAGTLGDDVDARAALDYVGIYANAATQVVPLLKLRDLLCEFVDCVHTFLWCEACMRSATVHDDFGLAYALTRCFHQAEWTERRLEHKNGVAAACFRFDELAGGVAADFFIGGPEEDYALAERRLALLQSVEREESLHDAGFHVERAGAVDFSGGYAERHFG